LYGFLYGIQIHRQVLFGSFLDNLRRRVVPQNIGQVVLVAKPVCVLPGYSTNGQAAAKGQQFLL
jgi:hypothetical protein